MALSDLDGVISQEVVEDVLVFSRVGEEYKHFSVVVQELFLGSNSSSTEFLLQELEELLVFLWWNWDLRLLEGIRWDLDSWALRLVEVLK